MDFPNLRPNMRFNMDITLYTLSSMIHDAQTIARNTKSFLNGIEEGSGYKFNIKGQNFDEWNKDELNIIYIGTGGTENLFKEAFNKITGHIILLTSGKSNSLAASMEILSFLRKQGRTGEIIHGSTEYIASRVKTMAVVHEARKSLKDKNIGVIGKPSDWLISSSVNKAAVKDKLGINIIEIPIEELNEIFDTLSLDDFPPQIANHFDKTAPGKLKKYREGSFKLYLALDKIVNKYNLSGFTLRCFDLLTSIHNTGCLGLAIMNARGIPACCEGDIPALITMMIGNAITGVSGFQANPSRIDPEKGEITFAHCTIPLNMVKEFKYNTHFESGIGVAIKGELEKGPVTLAKVSGELDRSWFMNAKLKKNLSEEDLCRTQVVIHAKGTDKYFLNDPIGNHHIIFPGHVAETFEAFMQAL